MLRKAMSERIQKKLLIRKKLLIKKELFMEKELFMKKKPLPLFFCLFWALMLSGCGKASEPISRTGFYFDTAVTITVYDATDEPLIDTCFSLCQKYEELFSRTKEGSDVYRINHSQGKPVEVSPETISLLQTALSYAKLSNGRIDPTIAPLSSLWDFGVQAALDEEQVRIPDETQIQEGLSHVGYEKIHLSGNQVVLEDPGASIDLGFVAKGYVADRLKEYLLEQGVEHALLDLGGNVLTLGSRPDGEPFRIGIQRPFDQGGSAAAILSVRDQSLVSSGVYQRYFEKDGRLYHHILDPQTGYPVENSLYSVTILSRSSLEGDALSTTCFCLGLEEGMKLIESLPGVEAVFITQDQVLHPSSGISLDGNGTG